MTIKQVRLFNTLSRKVEDFEPLDSAQVNVYCCGPTVYNTQHIGNLRCYVFEDTLIRTLRYAGYKVKHVMNITDVGHLVGDGDEGEDKMLVAVKREGKRSYEIAEHYSKIFFDHCAQINIIRPDVVCKATDHVPQMIELAKKLEERGYAYFTGGNLYYDVTKFPHYGDLAKLDMENLQAGARIEVDFNKKNALDFVLWFTNSKFEDQEMQWDSPWGRGYPGWHIECSAMSKHYLGDEFDIHCGGRDHISVHHSNEIAQSFGATGKMPAKIWSHSGWLVVGKDNEKMAKSTGGFLVLDTIIERGSDPLAYRYFCLQAVYRRDLSWSWEGFDGAERSLQKLKSQILTLKAKGQKAEIDKSSEVVAHALVAEFEECMFNDLNTPTALAVLYKALSSEELTDESKLAIAYNFDQIFGLGMESWQQETIEIPQEIAKLLALREAARKNKDWAESDRIRDQIIEHGYVIEDSKDGARVKRKS
ncbi:MAG: cysteine--tRNA ligase [Deltaproteobacteria bacterium]|nr:cysteine--tRNA ligase [Deltaproteobacteria bacterium]